MLSPIHKSSFNFTTFAAVNDTSIVRGLPAPLVGPLTEAICSPCSSPSSPKKVQRSRRRCVQCGGLVHFADRKVAMGQHWHQQCFKCTTCGRFLDPGRHQEYDDQPYCQVCYLGMTQKHQPVLPPQSPQEINEIIGRIKDYNLYKQNPKDHIRHREVGDNSLVYEGVLRLYWGLKRHITLSSGSSGYGRQRGPRESLYNYVSIDDDGFSKMFENAQKNYDVMSKEEMEELMSLNENGIDGSDRVTQGLNESALLGLTKTESANTTDTIVEEVRVGEGYVLVTQSDGEGSEEDDSDPEHDYENVPKRPSVIMRQKSDVRPNRVASHAGIRRRSASFRKVQRQRRQAEAREERQSKFVPPYGKPTNLRVSSIQGTDEVITMLLQKFNAENPSSDFVLFINHDNGAVELLGARNSPLAVRLKLGPSEDVAKIYVMESSDAGKLVSQETAEYIKFQLPELNLFLRKYTEEEEREVEKLKKRFETWKGLISEQLQSSET